MTNAGKKTAGSLFSGLFGSRDKAVEAEKSRFEAFLTAFPGDYCGWSRDGAIAYSPGFCEILGLPGIKTFDDIQAPLSPGDAAALESLWSRLKANGTPFTIIVQTADGSKYLKISGTQGHDLKKRNFCDALWVEDVTNQTEAQKFFAQQARSNEQDLERMTMALNSLPRPIWLRDEKQKIIWCNEIYAEFLNTTRDKVVAQQKEIAAQAIRKKVALREKENAGPFPGPALAEAALQSGEMWEAQVHAIIKGTRALLRVMEIPLKSLSLTLGMAVNNTREEELEIELKRHQSSNRELLGQLRTAIAIYAADERLEFYNSAFSQLWHLNEQWLNARPRLGDLMEKLRETRRLPEQADFRRFKRSWLDMFTGLIEPHDDMLHLPDGTALRMLVIPHSMGGLMMTFEDVTSRLQLESSYNTLIAVQKETLDNLSEAVAAFGGDGRLKLWNPSFGRLWGLHPEDLEGEPHIIALVEKMKAFFAPDIWPAKKEKLMDVCLNRVTQEARLMRADDSLIDLTSVPLPDGGVLVTYKDVTDTVRVETALREKNAALETAERLKLDFLANVSYQLRTPLNAIMGFTEILAQEYFGKLNERQKEYTSDMKEAGEKLLGLINDILDLSTLEAGYMKLERGEIDLFRTLKDVRDLVTGWARKENVDIEMRVPEDIGLVSADERRLQQAIINLVRNSIAFTKSGGKITLSAERVPEGVAISVSDTGVGISKEDRARIFEPFERAQNISGKSRAPRSGAGLGLSLVRNIIALHGGSVSLESEPGQGTTVTLFLPAIAQKTNLKLKA